MNAFTRRQLLTTGVAAATGAAGLAAAARIAQRHGLIPPDCRGRYGAGETLTYAAQRLLTRHSLAREFPRSMISQSPFANATNPPGELFDSLRAHNFRDYRLAVGGMIRQPTSFSLADLHTLPIHSQITEVVCEEGWSYIAEWIGTPLSAVLSAVGMLPQARYVVYDSIDKLLWGSIDMADALHPQTLLTLGMNDADLPVPFGGPLRLRVPRQLGYKSLKYISRIVVTDNLKSFGKGLGSIDPEYGYSWYAGI